MKLHITPEERELEIKGLHKKGMTTFRQSLIIGIIQTERLWPQLKRDQAALEQRITEFLADVRMMAPEPVVGVMTGLQQRLQRLHLDVFAATK